MAPTLSRRDPVTEVVMAVLREFDVEFAEDPQYPIADLQHSQVRGVNGDRGTLAPSETIWQVRAKIQNGEPLPPIVVTQDGELVDGNTRVTAARKEKHATLYAAVTTKTSEELGPRLKKILGARLNDHGKRLSRAEIERHVEEFLGMGVSIGTISRHLSIPEKQVSAAKAVIHGKQRLSTASLDADSYTRTHQIEFGRMDELLDEPFRELAHLADLAGMTVTEVRALAKRVKECGSEGEQMALLRQERQERDEVIRARRETGRNGRPSLARQAKGHLEKLLAVDDDPAKIVQSAPEKMGEQLHLFQRARDYLTAALTEQERLLEVARSDSY